MAITRADIRLLSRLVRYLNKYKLRLSAALLCAVFIAGLTALYAWMVRPFLDGIFIEKNRSLLLLLPVAIMVVTILKAVVSYAQAYLTTYVSHWLVADLREELFLSLIHLPVTFHDSNSSGRLSSRVMSDVSIMAGAIPGVLKNLVQQVLICIAMLGVLLAQDWKLTTALMISGPLAVYLSSRFNDRLRRLAVRGQELAGDMAAFLSDTFSGIRILKIYGREAEEAARFQRSNRSVIRTSIKAGQISAWISPITELVGMTAVTSIMVYGGYQVVVGQMTPGAFSSFVAGIIMAYSPVRKIANTQSVIQSTLAAADRVFRVLDLEHEDDRDVAKRPLPPISRSVEFRHVTFRYVGSQDNALIDISFIVRRGEAIAIVGRTGSGKTTLANLLPRFYDPTAGEVLVDGTDIRTVSLASLRKQMAIVSQDTFLFDDTVRNNIAYSRVGASDEDILDAARAAYAMEFIDRLPSGLDTLIGENGIKLSGGQRQRLAIARAILRNAPLLILDEATSSLDTESEQIVHQGLMNLMKDRTTLVIAHRLSTIQRADRIVVLHQGRIVGQGIHDALLDQCEVYQGLCSAQFHGTIMHQERDR